MTETKKLRNRIRGWFPQEPLYNNFSVNSSPDSKRKAELNKKLAKHSSIANAIVMATSFGINTFLIRPYYNYQITTESSILFFSIFTPALLTANLLLYWRYKKQLAAEENK